jgi:hypothetical protein
MNIATKTIWKYRVPLQDEFSLDLPSGAQILTVQEQCGSPHIWVKVQTGLVNVKRNFRVYGTGHDMDQDGEYIGTFQMSGGQLVFHLFEI